MFVKPHDVPPLLCFDVQTEITFGVEHLLFPEGRGCEKELFYLFQFARQSKAAEARHVVSQT